MSQQLFAQVTSDETIRQGIRQAVLGVVTEPRTRQDVSALARRLEEEPGLATRLERAISGAAGRHGLTFDASEFADRELSDLELDGISGGPTAVEYAVMLSLIIVVCLTAAPAAGKVQMQDFHF